MIKPLLFDEHGRDVSMAIWKCSLFRSIPIHRFEPCGPPNEKFCCHLLRASGSGFIFLGCGKLVEVVMRAFQLIHNCDAAKYKQGEIVEILPPHTKAPPSLVYSLHMAIHRKKYGWRVD